MDFFLHKRNEDGSHGPAVTSDLLAIAPQFEKSLFNNAGRRLVPLSVVEQMIETFDQVSGKRATEGTFQIKHDAEKLVIETDAWVAGWPK